MSESDAAQSFLLDHSRWATREIDELALDAKESETVWHEVMCLPVRDLALLVPLDDVPGHDIERVLAAIELGDRDKIDAALHVVLPSVDTPEVGAGLARRILDLRGERRLDSTVAAAAIIELAGPSSVLMGASLVVSIALSTMMKRMAV